MIPKSLIWNCHSFSRMNSTKRSIGCSSLRSHLALELKCVPLRLMRSRGIVSSRTFLFTAPSWFFIIRSHKIRIHYWKYYVSLIVAAAVTLCVGIRIWKWWGFKIYSINFLFFIESLFSIFCKYSTNNGYSHLFYNYIVICNPLNVNNCR